MKNSDIYSFVFRGSLIQTKLNRALMRGDVGRELAERIARTLPTSSLDREFVQAAEKMSPVFRAISAFENSARKFIQDRLLESIGADWWAKAVPAGIRDSAEKRKEDEKLHRYHGNRGSSMVFYCQLGDLASIIQNNFDHFRDHIPSIEWARQIITSIERSRNVIMHGGELTMNDVERVAMNIRDWIEQTGG